MRLIYLGLAWILGVCFGSWAGLSWIIISAAIAAASVLTFLSRRHRALLLLGLCLIAFLGGSLRFQSTVTPIDEHVLQYYNDKGLVAIRGLVAAAPEPGDGTTRLRFEAREIKAADRWRQVSGVALVYAPSFPNLEGRESPYYRYGDLLQFEAEPETPPQLVDLVHFDWRDFLARQGISTVIFHPRQIELLASDQGMRPLAWLYELRGKMSQALNTALPEPQGSLAQAMLLGQRSTIPTELREDFSRTGTAHLIAISGLHISIVAGIILSLGVWVFGRRRPTYFLISLVAIWLYALLTGMQPSALRAAIMGSLWLFANYIGRPRSALTSLLLAAALMVGIQPLILWRVSFQLSFAAMAGLILLTPHFQALGRRALGGAGEVSSGAGFVIDSLSVTLGAFLTTLPIIAFYFHIFSRVALPANFFALPALPGIMVTAALVGGVGLLAPPVAQVLGWVCWLFLSYLIGVIKLFSALPFASADNIESFDALLVWGYYAVLAAALYFGTNWKRMGDGISRVKKRLTLLPGLARRLPMKWALPPLIIAALLVWTAAATAPDNRLHVFFLDVGQGDAILIQRGSQQILVDGGPSPEAIGIQLGNILPFWDRTIELVILTHPEEDHIAGLVEVLRRYRVKQVLTSEQEHESSIYREWLRLIEEKNIKCAIARAGQRIEMGQGVRLEVLHPQPTLLQGTASDVNNNSVVLRVVLGDASFLLTGDIFEEGERCILNHRFDLSATVLKVGHHGSDTSTSPEFLAAVGPRVAVISVGADNPFGHPSPEVVERLKERLGKDRLYITAERGAIELITDGEKLWVKVEG